MTWSKTARAVHEFIKTHELMGRGERLLVAFSGGRDSVALLHLLIELNSYWHWELIIGHINHGLRPGADEPESDFSRASAFFYNFIYLEKELRLEESHTSEATAREHRYQALMEWKAEHRADKIVTGHHKDDQAETILYRLLNGSSVRGLGGIHGENRGIVRPLLCLDRDTINHYIADRNLPYYEDASNSDDQFARNFIRQSLLPAAGERFPSARDHLVRISADMQDAYDLIEHSSRQFIMNYARNGSSGKQINRSQFVNLHHVIQRDVLTELFAEYIPLRHFSRKELDGLIRLIETGRSGQHAQITDGVRLILDRQTFFVGIQPQPIEEMLLAPEQSIEITGLGTLEYHILAEMPRDIKTDERYVIFGEIGGDPVLKVRSWRAGDRMIPFGSDTDVRVSDILTNHKVSAVHKDRWPLVIAGDKILWIPGVRRSAHWPMSGSKKEIFSLLFKSETTEEL